MFFCAPPELVKAALLRRAAAAASGAGASGAGAAAEAGEASKRRKCSLDSSSSRVATEAAEDDADAPLPSWRSLLGPGNESRLKAYEDELFQQDEQLVANILKEDALLDKSGPSSSLSPLQKGDAVNTLMAAVRRHRSPAVVNFTQTFGQRGASPLN
eukprot:8162817-Alexandrium_andersonii.AAC.1